MRGYKAKQIEIITDAVAAARLEMRRQRRFTPQLFAQVFIAHGGIQIPGEPDNEAERARVAEAVTRALAGGQSGDIDPTVQRELQRARQEASWTEAAESDWVVGFSISLSPQAARHPVCEHLLNDNRGLGANVFRKHEIVVLRPECDGCSFQPVYADDLEC